MLSDAKLQFIALTVKPNALKSTSYAHCASVPRSCPRPLPAAFAAKKAL